MNFIITRILGDELPPRDIPGRRLEALRWILANEPKFPDSQRLWVLNVAADPVLLEAYKNVLIEADEQYIQYGRDWTTYDPKADRYERIRRAIDINGARNYCIRAGIDRAGFIFVLDGDCFFLQKDWDVVAQGILANQAGPAPVQYFSMPTQRVAAGDPERALEASVTEPMLCFRYDAEQRFDESRRFGDCPKQELLWRLGHDPGPSQSHRLIATHLCVQVGLVRHYANGDDASESSVERRMQLRDAALTQLLARVEALRCPATPSLGQ